MQIHNKARHNCATSCAGLALRARLCVRRYNLGENVNRILKLIVLVKILTMSTLTFAGVNFSETLHCEYQKGQVLSKNESESVNNSTPLKWTFNGLKSDKPMFISGGDVQEVVAIAVKGGFSIYSPYDSGAHSFTIWSSGESYWNKQSNLIGNINSQQYIGTCSN